MNLTTMSEQQILDLRLCDLAKLPTPKWVNSLMTQVRSELTAKNLLFCPHFWFGTEWFCPDGVAGMALPFYLLHPKLVVLEKKYTKHVEGISEKEFLKLARHELGHIVDNVYSFRKLKSRNMIFVPTNTPYPNSYTANPYSKNFVRHIAGNYAQAHPEEDWAETFAVWLSENWHEKYKRWPAIKKLEYVNQVMQRVQGQVKTNLKRTEPFHIKNDRRTLKQYFQDKQKERKINRKDLYKPKIPKAILATNGYELNQVITSNEKVIIDQVKFHTNLSSFQIKPMVKLLKQETRGLHYTRRQSKRKIINKLSKIIIQQENRFKKQGRHRIIM